MSVEITFEPSGLTGLVAEGTYLSHAARRMGLLLSVNCKAPGECRACFVTVLSGAGLLSLPSETEFTVLGEQALSQQQRLACQVILERSGELIVRLTPETESEAKPTDTASVKTSFRELTLDKKISTLIQLEALTLYEAMNAVVEKPLAIGEKVFDRFLGKSKAPESQNKNKS